MVNRKSRRWAPLATATASAVLVIALIGVPFAVGQDDAPVAAAETAALSAAPAARTATDTAVEEVPTTGLMRVAAASLPAGYRVDVEDKLIEAADPVADHRYQTLVRGVDPDQSPDWAVIRIRVNEHVFDADEWVRAYHEGLSTEDGTELLSAYNRAVEKTTVRGLEGVIERPVEDGGHTVLRWSEDGAQIIISGTAGATEAELREVAEGLDKLGPAGG